MSVVYLCKALSANGDSYVVDILGAYQERIPPVLHVDVTGTPSYTVYGSHIPTGEWHSYFSGSAGIEKDLVVGVRYWKITKTGGTGTVTAAVGPVPDRNGQNILPAIYVPYVTPGPS